MRVTCAVVDWVRGVRNTNRLIISHQNIWIHNLVFSKSVFVVSTISYKVSG